MKSYDITFGKPESLEGLTYYEVKFKHQPRIEDVEGMLRSYAPNIYEHRSVLIGLANHFPGKAWKSRFTLSGSFCELNEFRCPHAWSYDRKIKAAMNFMEE